LRLEEALCEAFSDAGNGKNILQAQNKYNHEIPKLSHPNQDIQEVCVAFKSILSFFKGYTAGMICRIAAHGCDFMHA